ncbi:MAG: PSD1 domain-containing protein [Planctomycetes bacterium]|nr:PSD1 domain-containing protein [Planctomycetota bacterium]
MRLLLALFAALLSVPAARAADPIDYTRDIKPILAKNCVTCHGAVKQRSGLRLDTAKAAFEGGNSGPVVVAGKSAASRIIHAVTGTHDAPKMPPKGPRLNATQIALLKRWIDEGARAPAGETVQTTTPKSKHWSFQPIKRLASPAVKDEPWVRNPIDRFILARLEKEHLHPSPEADRATLIRRVSLDLTGLPPTPAEVDVFINDPRPDAYEHLVDRLLGSPHYGERWGRHWLDLARYADSHGFTIDGARTIWPYRDWVLDALNRDLPFDQFVIEQLAGDLLPKGTREQRVATGFHRNTLFNQEGGIDQEQFRNEFVVDRVSTTGNVFFGLTIGCAQCHDHKYDPIAQREFYQLFAFFNSCDEPTIDLPTPEQEKTRKEVLARVNELDRQRKVLDTTSAAGLVKWEKGLRLSDRDHLAPDIQRILDLAPNSRDKKQAETLREVYRTSDMARHIAGALDTSTPFGRVAQLQAFQFRQSVDKQIAKLKNRIPPIPTTLVLSERATPRPTNIHLGGDFTRKGAPVVPAVPAILHPMNDVKKPNRLDLAKWIVDPKNPLTARVTVNRFWQRYFGLGLVETENDFGTQGTPPTHPELLDWLSDEFVARKWSMKAMHRLIVTSATYRQSSRHRPELANADPRNRLLARQNRLRLDAEIVRDNALAASGLLTAKIGGASVYPPQPEGVYAFTQIDKAWKPDTGPDRYRRGLYTYFWRSAPHPGLMAFDAPEANTTCTRRNRSNTPLQALTLLNDEAFVEFARGLALRGLKECPDDALRLRHLFRLCLAREPSAREQQRLEQFLARQVAALEKAPAGEVARLVPPVLPKNVKPRCAAAWTMLARVLLNLDEFITRE